MTRSQELALDHIREAEIANEAAMDWLRERVAELESENAELRAELEELAPMRKVQEALHKLLLRSDVVQYFTDHHTLRLGHAHLANYGNAGALLEALFAAAQAFTEDK